MREGKAAVQPNVPPSRLGDPHKSNRLIFQRLPESWGEEKAGDGEPKRSEGEVEKKTRERTNKAAAAKRRE